VIDNPYVKTILSIFNKRLRVSSESQKSPDEVPSVGISEPLVYVTELAFKDGTKLTLNKDSIIVLTGPNNSGKSSVLQAIEDNLIHRGSSVPVLDDLHIKAEGTEGQFQKFIQERTLPAEDDSNVVIQDYRRYRLNEIRNDVANAFRGSEVSSLFFSRLNAEAKLSSVKPARRDDWTKRSPSEPLQWLDLEMDAETEICQMFRKVFGLYLVVNRLAGQSVILHVCDHDPPEFNNFRAYRDWLTRLPTLESQGDGMKSFAATLLAIKVHPKSLILLDEPEAFLHDPQSLKLAEVITNDTSKETQIWVATHSDEIVRGLLNSSSERIVIVRLDRVGNNTSAKVLEPEAVNILWADPFLRTSDVLSALFHEVAVICEGESDARFFRAMLDANKAPERLPDTRLYQVGGKDKITSIVGALRALSLPVCVVCDLDVLSDADKFLALYEALGGDAEIIKTDIKQILQNVNQRNPPIVGEEAARRLRVIADSLQSSPKLSNTQRSEIMAVAKEASAWARLKAGGYKAFENSTINNAFERIYNQSKAVGLLINRDGELESLCRDIPKEPKSAWLEHVLMRDLKRDPCLKDAREMLSELESCIRLVRHRAICADDFPARL
jgi:energy-coupling factor transporter ATP-binding protein EcfA2